MTPERPTPSAQLAPLAARLAGALAVLVGAVVLTGWALDLAPLKSVLPGWVTMKPNTAGAFILTGLALLLSSAFRLPPWCARLAQLCALLAGLIGLLSLAEYIFGWHPGFDQWLFPEPAGAVGTSDLGRMAPDTALCFTLFAAGFEIARRPRQTTGTLTAAMLFGSAITAVALIDIFSYCAPTLRTYGWGGLTMMALPTAVVFAALGAALIGIAGRGKTSAANSPAQPSGASRSGGGRTLLLVFALLATAIIAAGTFYLRRYERQFRSDAEQRLSAIADLKASELKLWRRERLGDGSILFQNSAFSTLVRRFLEKPEDTGAQHQLQQWIEKIQGHCGYDRVGLLDAHGVTRLSSPAGLTPASADIARGAAEVLRSGSMRFQDFYGNEQDQRVYLAILVPIFDEAGAHQPLGTVVLRIDPTSYLYPFIQGWPVPAQTAETLLFRQDGNDVLYLNDLRFRPGAALVLRLPASRTDLPAARAARGQRGIMQGSDYRGVQVLADLRGIPDSPWFMVAKMDLAEIYEPIRGHLWQVVAMIGIMLFWTAAGVGLVWRQQRLRLLQANYESELARSQLAAIVESSDDAIIGKDLTGHITSWNAGAEKLFGYAAGEMVGTTVARLLPPDRLAEEEMMARRIGQGERVPNFDTVRLAKGGRPLDVSVTASPIRNAAGSLVGASKVVHDISVRLRAEEQQRASEIRYRRLFEAAKDGILIVDAETGMIVDVNPFLIELLGVTREVFLGKKVWELGFFKDLIANEANFAELQQKKYIRYEDMALEGHDGRRHEVEFVSNVYLANHQKVIQCNIRDISERVKAQRLIAQLNAGLEQRVRERTAELEAANQELEAFSYSVSHDLRTPLRALDGFSLALAEDYAGKLDEKALNYLQRIRTGSQRMAELIDDLLNLSRLSREAMHRERVDLTALAQAVGAELSRANPGRAV